MSRRARKAEGSKTEQPAEAAPAHVGEHLYSGSSETNAVLRLQQTIGNQALLGLLEANSDANPHASTGSDVARPLISHARLGIQRAAKTGATETASGAGSRESSSGLIVDDSAASVGRGQMRKSEFIEQLRSNVCATASDALAKAGKSAEGCPYIEKWLSFYANKPPSHIERALNKYAPETANAASARDYIPAVNSRVRRAVETWAQTGQIIGVPDEIKGLLPGAGGGVGAIAGMIGQAISGIMSTIGSAISDAVGAVGSFFSGIGRALFKRKDGRSESDPQEIRGKLSAGQPLAGSVQARMGSIFGSDFSTVRVHTDSEAASLSESLNARAFTVGADIAFGSGEYQPGTLIGDALIAHELAHVAQQRHASEAVSTWVTGEEGTELYEAEADDAAIHAVTALHGGVGLRRPRSALLNAPRLQRCSSTPPQIKVPFGGSVSEEQADQLLANDPLIYDRIKDRVAKGTKATGHTRTLGTIEFINTAYEKVYQGRTNPRTQSEYTFEEAAYEVMSAGGFTVGGEIYLHRKDADYIDLTRGGKSTPLPVPPSHHPATEVHETVHLYGSAAWASLVGRAGNEGATEYFTRRLLSKQKNPEIEGGAEIFHRDSYPVEYEAVKCLVSKANDGLLADAFFLGKIQPLRDKVGAAQFNAWAAAMTAENLPGAFTALGCKQPAAPAAP